MPPLTASTNTPQSATNTPASPLQPLTIQPQVQPTVPITAVGTQPVQLPSTPAPQAPVVTNEADRILQATQVQDTQAQQTAANLSERIFRALPQLAGERQALAEEQQRAGVGQFRQQLQDINSQILRKQAELQQDDVRLIQSVQNIEQQRIPMEFITGQQQSVQRDAQIARALKASEIGILNASAIAMQGNIALAMETAQQAVDVKYAPYKEEIALYKSQLEALQPILSRDEKRQAREQEIRANLALRDLERRQAEESKIQSLGIKLAEFGVDRQTISNVVNSKDFNSAILAAGAKLQDPRMRFEIEKMKLDSALQRERIATERRQRELMGEVSAKDLQKQAEAMKNKETAVPVLKDKVLVLDGILNSPAIDSVVGTSFLSRAAGSPVGVLARAVVAGPLALQGAKDMLTGERQKLIGSVNQMVSSEFLQQVINLKAQGGTLGQLTEREGDKLQQAATKIGTWEIRDPKTDKVVGYNVSEAEFKREIARIKEATERILRAAEGSIISQEEEAMLDSVFNTEIIDPANYYK